VVLNQILSECWQEGDRLRLLKEANRILSANGRLLLAERTRTQTNWLVHGLGGAQFHPVDYWQDLLVEAGFVVHRQQDLHGLIHCFRAHKPSGAEARQLALELPL
jgi:hypothetical protein